jgi:error-prone DNA polymerase
MEDGTVVPLLAANRTGYQNLCRLITEAKLIERENPAQRPSREIGPKPQDRKRPCFATWRELAHYAEGLIALTGDEDGPVRRAWQSAGGAAASAAIEKLIAIFGADPDPARARLFVELQRHRLRGENREIQFLVDLASARRLPVLATGGVNYATSDRRATADLFTCLRLHTTLDAAGRSLGANSERHLKSAGTMRALFADLPSAVEHSVLLAERLEFSLANLGVRIPHLPDPGGLLDGGPSARRHLRRCRQRLGPPPPALAAQLDRELTLIAKLGFSGYFLVVWDICRWAREERGILVQGRGSAANSAVCYVLGITAVNPLTHRLLFERFLSEGRVGADGRPSWPDIDLDFPSGERRESVIQEVYRRYGPRGAAMTANVITYRGRSAVREIGKVLGFGEDALNRFSGLYASGDYPQTLGLEEQLAAAGIAAEHPEPRRWRGFITRSAACPRHLGQHSGGMVICRGQLDGVMPLENASMPGRVVGQWDKDDCEDLGIVKVDFLGLGMMAVLQDSLELCATRGGPRHLHEIPTDDAETFVRIRAADTIGVFQIESRAQMATLPRFKPRNLYDLAMQVAIVRPGPITGQLVHPLLRRRAGLEPVDYIDPSVESLVRPILERTQGVILFRNRCSSSR